MSGTRGKPNVYVFLKDLEGEVVHLLVDSESPLGGRVLEPMPAASQGWH